MPPVLRRLLFACLVTALVGGPPTAASASSYTGQLEPPTASVGFDLIVLRPVGLVATAVGVALAVPAVAMCALTHPQDVRKPIDFLVMRPARYTFGDPIGTH